MYYLHFALLKSKTGEYSIYNGLLSYDKFYKELKHASA